MTCTKCYFVLPILTYKQTKKQTDQQIKGNSTRNNDFCKVRNFCQGQPSVISCHRRQPTTPLISLNEKLVCTIQLNHLLVAATSSWRVIRKAEKQCDKASPFSRPFFIGKVSEPCLLLRNLLLVSFKHNFITLKRFIGTPDPVMMLYKTNFLTES